MIKLPIKLGTYLLYLKVPGTKNSLFTNILLILTTNIIFFVYSIQQVRFWDVELSYLFYSDEFFLSNARFLGEPRTAPKNPYSDSYA